MSSVLHSGGTILQKALLGLLTDLYICSGSGEASKYRWEVEASLGCQESDGVCGGGTHKVQERTGGWLRSLAEACPYWSVLLRQGGKWQQWGNAPLSSEVHLGAQSTLGKDISVPLCLSYAHQWILLLATETYLLCLALFFYCHLIVAHLHFMAFRSFFFFKK